MRGLRFVYAIAFVVGISGCGSIPPLPADVTSPIVDAGTVGGCTESHKPFPAYAERVPYTGVPDPRKKVAPVYPEEARKQGLHGTVVLAALVCEHGKVVKTRVIESIPGLDDAATDAARQWEFQPAMIRDIRVATWWRVPIKFSLH